MSSSHNTTKSYDFQIIIHKVKYVSNEAQPNQFSLHIQFDNDEIEIENLYTKEENFESKEYPFTINNIKNPFASILITAYSSWFIISNKIASISIPFSITKINSQRQWYYLQNEKDENVLSILLAFSSHSIPFPNKQDQSMSEMIHTHLLSSVLSRTSITPNITKHISYDSGLLLRQKTTNSALSNNKIDKSFHERYENSNIDYIIKEKKKMLNKAEEHVKIEKCKCSLALEKIKERENILKEEGIQFKENILNTSKLLLEYETKKKNYAKKKTEYVNNYNAHLIKQEVMNFDKDMCSNINYIYILTNNLTIDKELKNKTNCISKQHNAKIHNPSNKKSNSTNMTSTNSSEISINDYNILKTPQITQVFHNTHNNFSSKFIEILDTDTYEKRGSVANNNSIQGNSIRKNLIAANKKTHIKKGAYSNLCLNSTSIKKKQNKQTVIALSSNKPINTVYNSNIKIYSSYFQNSNNNSYQRINTLSSSHFSTRSFFKVKRNKKVSL